MVCEQLEMNFEEQPIEVRVSNYLLQCHKGKSNSIPMTNLARLFNVSEREIREIIFTITDNGITAVGTSSKGYFIPKDMTELLEANDMLASRIKGSIRRYAKNGVNNLNWIYTLLKDLELERGLHPEGQISIENETVSYINKEK